MSINANTWNKIRYTAYAPLYTWVVQFTKPMRQKSLALLHAQPNEKILIVGAGAGDDFEFLRGYKNVVATDITPAMVAKMKRENSKLNANIEVLQIDGQQLLFPDATFDCVILHLVVAVIPNAQKCLQESARVLKPTGRIVVMDKFLLDGEKASFWRKLINPLTSLAFTTLNRNLTQLAATAGLRVEQVESASRSNLFRIAKLTKY